MRLKIKGINSKKVRLADGQTVTYYYAWKGGPRLHEKPGTPEFIASYHEAFRSRAEQKDHNLISILRAFAESQDFHRKAPRTRVDYLKQIEKIELRFGSFPIGALSDRRARDEFLTWRDKLAESSLRQAEYTLVVFAAILAWAKNRGKISVNPLERMGRIYNGNRVEIIWRDEDEAAFMRVASEPMRLAMMLALWTGQRQGDLLRLTWAAYDGEWIRIAQSKTGVRLPIPIGKRLREILNSTKRQSPFILVNSDGAPWTPDGFRSSWRKTCAKAGISGLTFHDLRGTAVTRLALADCSEAEIAAITGHSIRDVKSILERHYLKRDPTLAANAIAKLERRTKIPE